MSVIWTKDGPYRRAEYKSEADLEHAILLVQKELFGANRIYLPVKRKIGKKGAVQNIPDGYLIDLSGKVPRLCVVEVELSSHEPLKHIAVQILEFSLSFERERLGVKSILFAALQELQELREVCEHYATSHEFHNLDHLLEHLVFESPFAALVIIDELQESLEEVLARRFKFGVEVLELARYANDAGEQLYRFEPLFAEVSVQGGGGGDGPDTAEMDTVVVPAWADGVKETFLGENRWYAVRIHGLMRPQIKFIAVYQVAPISAITHVALVKSIEPWKDTGKCVINFSEPARGIGPIPLVKGGKVRAPQNLRYTTRKRLDTAKTLDDIW